MRPVGISLNKCVCDTHINFFLNFHANVNTLTIYFIALNESLGFVLIYRPSGGGGQLDDHTEYTVVGIVHNINMHTYVHKCTFLRIHVRELCGLERRPNAS